MYTAKLEISESTDRRYDVGIMFASATYVYRRQCLSSRDYSHRDIFQSDNRMTGYEYSDIGLYSLSRMYHWNTLYNEIIMSQKCLFYRNQLMFHVESITHNAIFFLFTTILKIFQRQKYEKHLILPFNFKTSDFGNTMLCFSLPVSNVSADEN